MINTASAWIAAVIHAREDNTFFSVRERSWTWLKEMSKDYSLQCQSQILCRHNYPPWLPEECNTTSVFAFGGEQSLLMWPQEVSFLEKPCWIFEQTIDAVVFWRGQSQKKATQRKQHLIFKEGTKYITCYVLITTTWKMFTTYVWIPHFGKSDIRIVNGLGESNALLIG